jgi:hypothetical protein
LLSAFLKTPPITLAHQPAAVGSVLARSEGSEKAVVIGDFEPLPLAPLGDLTQCRVKPGLCVLGDLGHAGAPSGMVPTV